MIQTSYDPEADAFSVWFAPEGVSSVSTEEVGPGVMLGFDANGKVIGSRYSECANGWGFRIER